MSVKRSVLKEMADKGLEFEAPTIKEAIEKAKRELSCAGSEMTFKVLKEEQKGLFGMEGAEKAKIRVTRSRQFTPGSVLER
jgi:predicted RNA-binding protein Jag